MVVSAVALVLAACSAGSPPVAPRSTSAHRASGSSGPTPRVRLVAAPAQLRRECAAAALRLGFAVPCLTKVPTVAGRAASCPVPFGAMPAPCVSLEGLARYPIFASELNGFDVPAVHVGVGDKAVGHKFIEARLHKYSPSNPCVGAGRLQRLRVGRWTAMEYTCPAGQPRRPARGHAWRRCICRASAARMELPGRRLPGERTWPRGPESCTSRGARELCDAGPGGGPAGAAECVISQAKGRA